MPGALARRSTRRLAMLGGVFVLLAVMLVPPLRAYLVQQQQYRDLEASVTHKESTVTELRQRTQDWQNPAYVEQQSRARLRYVRPGETAYVVVGADTLRDRPAHDSLSVIDPGHSAEPRAWYTTVWDSIATGDTMGDDPRTAPVSRLDAPEAETDPTTGLPVTTPATPPAAPTTGP
ncbi:FtsB family cell division protein [Mobilicoccus pelagius]|uniref:Septum formation initiator family protein n=1 Tax=Mobilicoccus pelagius NBRC 104925 TaxID=1089455 RepID=H5USC6_9MICO|nr:septum formation initiator family protein [Mobilicoccus pelagius]GAB48634.1 hypothetical protein MOPEL_078_00230 [Mobilicoccus pelagius NBRC 104925]